jgi:hypothetical protein
MLTRSCTTVGRLRAASAAVTVALVVACGAERAVTPRGPGLRTLRGAVVHDTVLAAATVFEVEVLGPGGAPAAG